MTMMNNKPILKVMDIVVSMDQELTLLDWAKGGICLHVQFEGRRWVDDLDQGIMQSGFGGNPIRYYEQYDVEAGIKQPVIREGLSDIPEGRKKHPKFNAIANTTTKRKQHQVLQELVKALGKRTGYQIDWDNIDKNIYHLHPPGSTRALKALASNLVIRNYTVKGAPAIRRPWPEGIEQSKRIIQNFETKKLKKIREKQLNQSKRGSTTMTK
jgi:hypothetical protein